MHRSSPKRSLAMEGRVFLETDLTIHVGLHYGIGEKRLRQANSQTLKPAVNPQPGYRRETLVRASHELKHLVITTITMTVMTIAMTTTMTTTIMMMKLNRNSKITGWEKSGVEKIAGTGKAGPGKTWDGEKLGNSHTANPSICCTRPRKTTMKKLTAQPGSRPTKQTHGRPTEGP